MNLKSISLFCLFLTLCVALPVQAVPQIEGRFIELQNTYNKAEWTTISFSQVYDEPPALHTNDSVTSAIRLIDMGAAPYLVATSLRGVLAQRLVRRVCENCKEEKPATAQEQAWVGFLKPELAAATFYKGRGCNSCNHTGYKGRIGVFEFLEMNEDMMEALREDDTQGFVDATKANKDFVPLSHMALDYAAQGKTSLDEVFKVAEFVPEVVNH